MDVPIANDRMLTGVKEARFQDTRSKTTASTIHQGT
jgi:hypothetical protein